MPTPPAGLPTSRGATWYALLTILLLVTRGRCRLLWAAAARARSLAGRPEDQQHPVDTSLGDCACNGCRGKGRAQCVLGACVLRGRAPSGRAAWLWRAFGQLARGACAARRWTACAARRWTACADDRSGLVCAQSWVGALTSISLVAAQIFVLTLIGCASFLPPRADTCPVGALGGHVA